MNISFQGTYKILASENPKRTEDIFKAADTIYEKCHATDILTDYPQENGKVDVIWTIPVDDCMNKTVDEILTALGIKFTRKNHDELFDKGEIKKRIQLPEFLAEDKYSLVEVDTDKFNKAYKAHSFAYVGDYKNVAFKRRYEGVQEYIRTDRPIDASIVFVKDKGDYPEIDFQDGRHRYAYMRNIGMEKIPLAMDEASKKACEKFGLL